MVNLNLKVVGKNAVSYVLVASSYGRVSLVSGMHAVEAGERLSAFGVASEALRENP
jgi:hypothetical protein